MIDKLIALFTHTNFSLFFKANLFLTSIIFSIFMINNTDYDLFGFLLILFACISSATILYLVFFIILFIFRVTNTTIIYISALLFILTNISLIVDFFIYKIYKFHINAMVLNILSSPDSMDSIQLGVMPTVMFVVFIVLLIAYEVFLIKKINKLNMYIKKDINKKLNKLLVLPLFLIILGEKITYGALSLSSQSEIVSKFKVIPLYQPLTFSRIAFKYFGYKTEEKQENRINTDALLNYPLEKIKINDNPNKINIFIFASDSVRNSNINSQITPNVENFKKDSFTFNNHHSGGNATRFGIYSIFYGLNSTYWFSFLNAGRSPVLIDTLKDLDYNFKIISSTNTSWPEFRKTAYSNIIDAIKDDFVGSPWQKDEQSSKYFMDYIKNYDSKKPLFSFVFLDAPHGYSFPQYANKFKASKKNVNYLSISKDSKNIPAIHARFKNSVYFNDILFGKMIQQLKDKGLYDNSLIIFTSDHGSEFFEYGYFGHNSSFSKAQTNTPFIIKLPKNLQDKVALPKGFPNVLTSHNDIVATLLSIVGVQNNSNTYSNGYNLFNEDFNRDFVFCANWNNNAVITNEYTYVFSNLPNKMFRNEVRYTKNYKIVDSNHKIDSRLLINIMNENRRFLK
ncbi:MAG: sulfatase-like hydrolase/transferase [Sulfurimonas sp.]|nr:sulfatase-like hydrolase/transferase [Sulfurimonas sp.]